MSDIVRRHNSSPAKKAPAKKAPAKTAAGKKARANKGAPEAASRMRTGPTAGAGSMKALPEPPTDLWIILGRKVASCYRSQRLLSGSLLLWRSHVDDGLLHLAHPRAADATAAPDDWCCR